MDGLAAKHSRMRLPTLLAHVAQTILAFVILGLAAYGVEYISYNVLIYSIAVNVCSLGVSSWLLVSRTFLSKFDNIWIALGLHAWMLVFWIVSLGLTADLTKAWSPQCSYTPEAGKICSTFVTKRDTTFRTYYGVLVVSSVLIGLQVILWLGTTALLALDLKCRCSTVTQSHTVGAGPRFSNDSQTTAGDIEKPNTFDYVSATPVRKEAEPVIPLPSPEISGVKQVEPFQPDQPTQHNPRSTLDQASIPTSPAPSEIEWIGLDGIDSVGSPVPSSRVLSQYATHWDVVNEARPIERGPQTNRI
ncbi:uncharacterized protein M421DRAFT_115828 [Didymella exigua CBS 183.55]|uniref:MARVEL domain-containing protein n=1 Tax=Didymella exigua CBS 183.55 TaxID=1150837 RepID=A0A6A5S443_9PLEO|nr:uncharacterized protein M421DRAFT_115828 [Didymella exigua CBS 183.55]KAF1934214.1 hypothetical protein M421DRAFT_115828 [Didymella exigua CBS 183.55]